MLFDEPFFEDFAQANAGYGATTLIKLDKPRPRRATLSTYKSRLCREHHLCERKNPLKKGEPMRTTEEKLSDLINEIGFIAQYIDGWVDACITDDRFVIKISDRESAFSKDISKIGFVLACELAFIADEVLMPIAESAELDGYQELRFSDNRLEYVRFGVITDGVIYDLKKTSQRVMQLTNIFRGLRSKSTKVINFLNARHPSPEKYLNYLESQCRSLWQRHHRLERIVVEGIPHLEHEFVL